jgi:hypothetical protein
MHWQAIALRSNLTPKIYRSMNYRLLVEKAKSTPQRLSGFRKLGVWSCWHQTSPLKPLIIYILIRSVRLAVYLNRIASSSLFGFLLIIEIFAVIDWSFDVEWQISETNVQVSEALVQPH